MRHRTLPLVVALVLVLAACKSGTQSPTVAHRMKDHDAIALGIRDAVTRGDLAEARRRATALAMLPVDGTVDAAWRQKLDAMDAAAVRIAEAPTVDDAAHGLGPLAKTCADCHTMLQRPWPAVDTPEGQASGARPFMVRHEWAASRMWDGLAIPSPDAWAAGAQVMAEEPLSPAALTPGKSPADGVGALERTVHDLGRQALASGTVGQRMAVYGEIAATCAKCHGWLRGGAGAAR
ncbi:MAG: hypothetical protein ACRELB_16780 [Polyangiaceae bacterium]